MRASINSRVVIQARTAEWQRQYRYHDYGPSDFLFGNNAKVRAAEQLRWFQPA
jgi:hypothetical protein